MSRFKRAFSDTDLDDGDSPDYGYVVEELRRCYTLLEYAETMAGYYTDPIFNVRNGKVSPAKEFLAALEK